MLFVVLAVVAAKMRYIVLVVFAYSVYHDVHVSCYCIFVVAVVLVDLFASIAVAIVVGVVVDAFICGGSRCCLL
jgi:hypothetical protein